MSDERTPEEEYADGMSAEVTDRARQLVAEWENDSRSGPLLPTGQALAAFECGIKAGYIATLEMLTDRGFLLWDDDEDEAS